MRVGEKETSEYAAIVERYADLFTREQYDALAGDDERVTRLREACKDGVVSLELATAYDELQNAMLAARIEFRGEEMPLRNAQAQVALEDDYAAREELGLISGDKSAEFNDGRLDLMRRGEAFESDLTGQTDPIARSEELKAIDLHELSGVLERTAATQTESFGPLRDKWLDRILGPEREDEPSSYHIAYVRRMSPLADVYSKERAVEVCLETLTKLGFDLAAESQDQARPRRPPAEEPACLRDRVRPAVGRPPDHARPGRHPRLPGVSPRGRPRAPLRGLRPRSLVHVPAPLPRPRADRDLLLPGRVDHPRAGLARGLLRPRRGDRARERRGDAVPRGDPLPSLRGQARLRARALG